MTPFTIRWERAENAADLPRDSSVVFPAPHMTIPWRPMLSSAVLDWGDAAPEAIRPEPLAPRP